MWGQKELRKHLCEKLEIGNRQLNNRIAQRAASLPSTREQALFVLAHEQGLKLQNYLTPEQIGEVRSLVQGQPTVVPSRSSPRRRPTKNATKRTVAISIAGVKVGDVPGLKPSHATEAKAMAERVYPTLYIFENSVRDFIERVCGSPWQRLVGKRSSPEGPRQGGAVQEG